MMRIFLSIVLIWFVFTSFADVFTWTGAENGCWTNPANWKVGTEVATRFPGVASNEIWNADGVYVDGWENTAHLTDLAEFTTVSGSAATQLDFSGLHCVSSLVFRAGCSAYTLGAHENDVLCLQAFAPAHNTASAGRLTVEKDATMPVFVGAFSVGASRREMMGTGTNSDRGYCCVCNNSDTELVFKKVGFSRIISETSYTAVGAINLYCTGSGNFRFDGPVDGMMKYADWHIQTFILCLNGTGNTVTFSTPLFGCGVANGVRDAASNAGLWQLLVNGTKRVEIQEGCRVALSQYNSPALGLSTGNTCEIGGKGTLQLCVQGGKGIDGNYQAVYVSSGVTGRISCILDAYDDSNITGKPESIWLRFADSSGYTGTFYFCGITNRLAGPVYFRTSPMTYQADTISGFGTGSNVYARVNASFAYAGTGNETLYKNFTDWRANVTNTVRNVGSGTLTVSSTFSVTNASHTGCAVQMDAATAPIVFAGKVLTCEDQGLAFTTKGSSTVILDSSADLTGVKSWRLAGGTLDVSRLVRDDAVTFTAPMTFDTATTTLFVPNGVTLNLASLAATPSQTAGKLNIICDTGRVKVADATAESAMPTGVLVNGYPAAYDAEGNVVLAAPTYDVAIGARGSVITNGAGVVAVMSAGTTLNNTLQADDTAITSLIHYDSTDTLVEIGEGRLFTTSLLYLMGLGGNLTIGTVDEAGVLAGANDALTLHNDNPNRALTVRARVAEGTTVHVEKATGSPTLAGGTTGDVKIRYGAGELKLTGDRTFHLNGASIGTNVTTAAEEATLRIDGAKDVQLGSEVFNVGHDERIAYNSSSKSFGRVIVTNSLVRNADVTATQTNYTTNNAICVGYRGNGILEIQAGALITNRLIVSGIYDPGKYWSGARGAVLQSGGEMVVLGSSSAYGGSFIGGDCGNGYYELKDGRLIWLGALVVSIYAEGAGSFTQLGGYSCFTNALGSETKSTVGPCAVANGGGGVMRFAGGRADIHANVQLSCGATNGGRSAMTVEDDAEVDAFDNVMTLAGAHDSTSHNAYFFKQADFVIVGGASYRGAGFNTVHYASWPDYPQYYSVGFNRGTFKTGASNGDICFANATQWGRGAMTNLIVYAGGVTIDTDGKTGNRASHPFKGAWGKGVSSFSFINKKYSGFIAAPYILIKGDGVGATAVADYDSASGSVTGIRILTPGAGYTYAKVMFFSGTSTWMAQEYVEPIEDCVLADNVNTGDFTKTGAGDFTLDAANTWGGKTILKEGVLRLGVANALPQDTTVVYEGGALEASAATSPEMLAVELSAETVSKRRRMPLVTYTDALPATLPEITFVGMSDKERLHWEAFVRGKTLVAHYMQGTAIILR